MQLTIETFAPRSEKGSWRAALKYWNKAGKWNYMKILEERADFLSEEMALAWAKARREQIYKDWAEEVAYERDRRGIVKRAMRLQVKPCRELVVIFKTHKDERERRAADEALWRNMDSMSFACDEAARQAGLDWPRISHGMTRADIRRFAAKGRMDKLAKLLDDKPSFLPQLPDEPYNAWHDRNRQVRVDRWERITKLLPAKRKATKTKSAESPVAVSPV